MKKVLLAFVLLLLVVSIPASALASVPVLYCSYAVPGPGTGTYADPWRCSTQQELAVAVNNVCTYGYGILYQTVPNGYYRHTVEDPTDGPCVVTSSVFYYGVPPNTGIALPAPLLIGIALTLGAALLAGGFFVYRKRYA